MKTICQQLKYNGVPTETHESDLLAKKTEISNIIVDAYEFKNNVVTFRSQIDGTIWYDIPFANDLFWEKCRKNIGSAGYGK